MPYIDDTVPGFGTVISNWVLGDSREFQRTNTNALDPGDFIIDAYLTIKSNQLAVDADSLLQVHVTQVPSVYGVIAGANIALIIYGTQLEEGLAGPVYYYDIVVVTNQGVRFTIEYGQITFVQGTTQAQGGGAPPVFPDSGLPNFKGFASGPPTGNYNFGIYNVGDVFFTTQGSGPDGWRCVSAGSPGVWIPLGGGGAVLPVLILTGPNPPPAGVFPDGTRYWVIPPISGFSGDWVYVAGVGWKVLSVVSF